MSKFDLSLALCTLFLLILGLIILTSVSPELFLPHLLFALLGTVLFIIFSRTDYRIYTSFSLWIYCLSLLLLIFTLTLGQTTRGATRWLNLGPFQAQTSELVKPLLILFFAHWFSRTNRFNIPQILISLSLFSLPLFLVFRQPDLGSSLILFSSWLGQLFTAGLPVLFLGLSLIILGITSPLLWHFLKDYQKLRLFTFLNPAQDPLQGGYNAIQAIITVGSGQFWGRGLGHGTQSHLRFLPERHTDFIFASLTEELGFIGGILVLCLFGLLLLRILIIAKNSPDKLGYLICIGAFSSLFSQIIINIGMNIGLLPIAGVTLPLISSGGSSLLSTLIILGLVESVASKTPPSHALQIH